MVEARQGGAELDFAHAEQLAPHNHPTTQRACLLDSSQNRVLDCLVLLTLAVAAYARLLLLEEDQDRQWR
jgi:hypothetical protein